LEKQPSVYLLASSKKGTIYIGVTSDLIKRVWEHKNNVVEGFTKTHNVHLLMWYEQHTDMTAAIKREKSIKNWKRDWKISLIEEQNPEWEDLYESLL
jgi:putative endonuclease